MVLGRNGNGMPLSAHESAAVDGYIRLVQRHVPAELVYALLFGSRARGTERPDSDIDVLLVFRDLPPDREPQATIAEQIAEDVRSVRGVPVEPWSVALVDLRCGHRTPMLVDALDDGIGIWPAGEPTPRPPFTPRDALRCADALLQRVSEGSDEVRHALQAGDPHHALRRGRDDVVRLSTAALLLHGETRPRRGDAVRRFVETYVVDDRFPARFVPQFRWAARSFGPRGDDEERPVGIPPGGFGAVAELIDRMGDWVADRRDGIQGLLGSDGAADPSRRDRR